MMEWISVEERPPEGPCIVYLEEAVIGTRIHGAVFDKNVSTIGGNFAFDMPKVLYWMPQDVLPEPPK